MTAERVTTPEDVAFTHKFRVPVPLREILQRLCGELERGEVVLIDRLYSEVKPWT